MQQNYTARAEQIMQRIQLLAAISEEADVVTRTFGTPAFLDGRALVQGWLETAGLPTRVDSIGNLRARLVSANPAAKTFVLASHIDTVVNAGKFDGPLGVLMALDLLEHLRTRQVELPFHIELIAFSDEEGVRFHTTYLGSKVVAGSFDHSWLTRPDAGGITLARALEIMEADAAQIAADAIPAANWLGYFEMHIEQGPVLWEREIPVALVTAIAGQMRVELTFTGMAGHAGTVPMDMRQDALCAAAEFILIAEQFALTHGRGLVATVGKLGLSHAASNVIPGEVTCSLDLRSADATQLAEAYAALKTYTEAIASQRHVALHWDLIQETAPAACDVSLNETLAEAIADAGHEVVALVSGAGHDAVPISAVAPVTMMFIRCYKGISHNPLEDVELADIAAALEVADRFIQLRMKNEELPVASSNSSFLTLHSSFKNMEMSALTRSVVKRNHAIIAPDGYINSNVPGWTGCTTNVIINEQMGARLCQTLITLTEAGNVKGETEASQIFFYVVQGGCTATVGGETRALKGGEYVYVPVDQSYEFSQPSAGTQLLTFHKVYEPLAGHATPGIFWGERDYSKAPIYMNDEALRIQELLPNVPGFDMAVNIFTYGIGGNLPMVETHIMEHGLLYLEGQAIYMLDQCWYPVKKGDSIWMAPYCQQWATAMGQEPSVYIYYKNVNRFPTVM